MKTGLILINNNDFLSIKEFIDNIKNYLVIEKIIVLNNNSNDNDKFKKIRNKKVEVLNFDSVKGYSFLINEGAKCLINEFGKCNIIVANPYIKINSEKDIKTLLKTLFKKDVGIVAPVILENDLLNRGWKLTNINTEIKINIFGKRIKNKVLLYKDEYYVDDEVQVDVVSKDFYIIKSSVLKDIDFLDADLFYYYEEEVLATKLCKLGKKIIINNSVMVFNNKININSYKKYCMLKKSQFCYINKYLDPKGYHKFLLKFFVVVKKFGLFFYYRFKRR